MKKKIKSLIVWILKSINKIVPKSDQVLIQGFPNIESSAISVANFIKSNYKVPVIYVVSNKEESDPKKLLVPGIKIINRFKDKLYTFTYLYNFIKSRYIFFTHGTFLNSFPSNQTIVNIWHGVHYKNVRMLLGRPPLYADVTVGTSDLTKKMFAEAFGVPMDSVKVTGYPRNDLMLKSKENKNKVKKRIGNINGYKKLIVWLPTYRKSITGDVRQDGREVGNPFYVADFNIIEFNELLNDSNTLCIVKPHPMAPKYKNNQNFSNVMFVDDNWLFNKGITLYELVGTSNLLISDVSSIIIDYLLMDEPIVCISTDFDKYRRTRGFYFDNIEDWIPSKVIKNQTEFFSFLKRLLKTSKDPYKNKREKLKDLFFEYHDDNSTERLVKYILNRKK